jgi:signal transduction histidine kinase
VHARDPGSRSDAARAAPVGPPTDLETYSLALAAVLAAVVTLAVDSRTPLTVALVFLALAPWAIVTIGVRLPLWAFFAGTVIPAATLIVIADAGAPVFFGMFAVTRVGSTTGRRTPVLAATLAAVALAVLFVLNTPDGPAGRAAYFTIGITACALVGAMLHHERRLTAELEASRRRLADAAAAEERHRIAREVHDALAHSLTAVIVNVAGARKALATQPELAHQALQRAERVGRDSLDTIRAIVGQLRPEDAAGGGSGTTASATDLPAIVAAQRESGADITMRVVGDLATVNPIAGSALVRIAQEALTNAARHAPGAPVAVEVRANGNLVLDVSNGPPRLPPLDTDNARKGLGLTSIGERVRALGGSVEAGPTADGGWSVNCILPLRPSQPSVGGPQ